MYKAMILDDETLIIKGLQNILDWDRLGVEIIHTATNGAEGLQKFKEEPVDIIITDINMPKLTGIELLNEIRALNAEVEVVILSGYDDFSYAKKAIELGVKSYLLKPVDDEELEAVIIDITKRLETKRAKSLAQTFNALLNNTGEAIKEEALSLMEELDYCFYTVSLLKTKACEKQHLPNIVEWLNQRDCPPIYVKQLEDELIIVEGWHEVLVQDRIEMNYHLMQTQLINALDIEVCVVVGNGTEHYEKIGYIYNEIKPLRRYMLVSGTNVVITPDVLNNVKNYDKETDLSQLQKQIIEKHDIEAENYIKQLFEKEQLSQYSPDDYYHIASKIIILLNEVIRDFSLQSKLEPMHFYNMMNQLNKISEQIELETFLIDKTKEVISIIKDNKVGYTPVVQQLITHVQNHYHEDMSLKVLSYKYNVNPSYLGQIFLKEVGCSFAQYLNQVKSKEAKNLILNTNLKMSEISKKVGYPDTSYFYRKFKEYYGVSPAALREIKHY